MNKRIRSYALLSAILLFVITTLYIPTNVEANSDDISFDEDGAATLGESGATSIDSQEAATQSEEPEQTTEKQLDGNDLYMDALKNTSKTVYDVYEVKKGSICTKNNASANVYFPISNEVTVPTDFGEVQFVKMLVSKGDQVKKGTPIAEIKTSVDEIALKQQTLELKRAKERYSRYISNQSKALKEQKKAINSITDSLDKKIAKLEYESAELNYQIEKESQSKTIKKMEKAIEECLEIKNTTKILSATNGMVNEVSDITSGEKIGSSTSLASIVDTSEVYFTLRDKNSITSYNMNVSFEAKSSKDNKVVEFTGKIVSCVDGGSEEQGTYRLCYIKPDKKIQYKDVESKSINASIEVSKMDNVLIAPQCCFEIDEEKYFTYNYVTCYELQGDILVKHCVVPGLYDDVNGQVAYGLEEGMKLVIKQK